MRIVRAYGRDGKPYIYRLDGVVSPLILTHKKLNEPLEVTGVWFKFINNSAPVKVIYVRKHEEKS